MSDPIVMDGAILHGNVVLGDDVVIYPGAKIGFPAESHEHDSDPDDPLVIEHGTIIREDVCIQRGIRGGSGTRIGGNCYLMHGTHVGHDVYLGNNVTAAPFTVFGGHTTVQSGATFGIHSATHQWCVIGAYVMVGMGSMVLGDVEPGLKVVGSPAVVIGNNDVGLTRHKVGVLELAGLHRSFSRIRYDSGFKRPPIKSRQ